jgi:hypothetical protein
MKNDSKGRGLPPLVKFYDGKELRKKSWLRPGVYSLDATPSLHCGVLYYPDGKTKEYAMIGDCDDDAK